MYFVAAVLVVLCGLFYAAALAQRCADTAARFAIIQITFWQARLWRPLGGHLLASDDGQSIRTCAIGGPPGE